MKQPCSCTISADSDRSYFEDDDGMRYYGAEATRRANAHFAEIEASNRAYVQQLTLEQRKLLERVLRRACGPTGPATVLGRERSGS